MGRDLLYMYFAALPWKPPVAGLCTLTVPVNVQFKCFLWFQPRVSLGFFFRSCYFCRLFLIFFSSCLSPLPAVFIARAQTFLSPSPLSLSSKRHGHLILTQFVQTFLNKNYFIFDLFCQTYASLFLTSHIRSPRPPLLSLSLFLTDPWPWGHPGTYGFLFLKFPSAPRRSGEL